jgi:hypothetical protein
VSGTLLVQTRQHRFLKTFSRLFVHKSMQRIASSSMKDISGKSQSHSPNVNIRCYQASCPYRQSASWPAHEPPDAKFVQPFHQTSITSIRNVQDRSQLLGNYIVSLMQISPSPNLELNAPSERPGTAAYLHDSTPHTKSWTSRKRCWKSDNASWRTQKTYWIALWFRCFPCMHMVGRET